MTMKKRKQQKQVRSNKRVFISHNIESAAALLGYYTRQVQNVVKKWRGRIPERFILGYYLPIANAALWKGNTLKLSVFVRGHWPLVWELAAACDKVRRLPKTCPLYWLLTLPLNVGTDGAFDSWHSIRWTIKKQGGPDFSTLTLRQAAKRLHLVTPPKIAAAYPKIAAAYR